MRELTASELNWVSGGFAEPAEKQQDTGDENQAIYMKMVFAVVCEIGVVAAGLIFGAAVVSAAIIFVTVLGTPTPAY